MQSIDDFERDGAFGHLRLEWGIYTAAGIVFLAAGYFLLVRGWELRYATIWAAVCGLTLVYHFGTLWAHLGENRPKDSGDARLYPTLGLANGITITRAILVAGLAGFLFAPWPRGWLAWLPGLLFLADVLMDFADGAAARLSGRVTLLGERLDMQWDSAGVLLASGLVILYGQAPLIYLWVGLARYLYLFGLWLHSRKGGLVLDLPPSRFRRAVAGMQMGYLAGALLPVFGHPATQAVAMLFLTPHFLGFLRDFLHVTGRSGQGFLARPRSGWFFAALPLFLRIGLIALLVRLLIQQASGMVVMMPWFPPFAVLAVAALALGAVGRVTGLAVLLAAGFALHAMQTDFTWWAILLCGGLLFMTGTGKFSLWKPEEIIIDRRVGDPRGGAR